MMIADTIRQRISGYGRLLLLVPFFFVTSVTHAQSPSKSTVAGQPMGKVLSSVVRIATRDQSLEVIGESLGLLVSEDGLIITNFLSVRDAHIATVTVSDGTTYFVESIVAKDAILDLALIRIRGQNMAAAKLSNGIIPPEGADVYALTSWEKKKATPSSGKVSSIWQTANKIDMVSFNVMLGAQGIGGPVVNKDGKLIGISNTVSRPFRRGSGSDTAICPAKVLASFVSKKSSETGTKLASSFNGAFGADGAGKLEKIWKDLDDKLFDDALRKLRVMPSLLQEAYIYSLTLGITQLRLSLNEAAARSFSNASNANPFDANPAYQGGLALRAAKKYEDSVLAFQAATQRNPQHIDAFVAMGRSYNAMRQPSLAIDVLSKALAIDKDNVDAHLNIGISYWGMSNREKTMDHLMQASMIAPRSAAGMRATALLDSGLPMPNEQ